jgi:hypothetical protein
LQGTRVEHEPGQQRSTISPLCARLFHADSPCD